MKTILGVQVSNRLEEFERMQNIFTEHGCIIKTILGLNVQQENACSERGVIILELNDNAGPEGEELENKLNDIEGLELKKMSFS